MDNSDKNEIVILKNKIAAMTREIESVSAENVYLLSRLEQLGDPNIADLVIELMQLKATGKITARIQISGYRQAISHIRKTAQPIINPLIHELLISLCNDMDEAATLRAGS